MMRFSNSGVLSVIDGNSVAIYLTSPFEKRLERAFDESISMVDIYGTSNIFAIVGSSPSASTFHDKKVVLFDDREGEILAEVGCSSRILNISFISDNLILLTELEVVIVNIHTLSRSTLDVKPHGSLLDVSTGSPIFVFSCSSYRHSQPLPSSHKGLLSICNLDISNPLCSVIAAHKSNLSCVAVSNDGSFIASTSNEGTLIRVWSTHGQLVSELRRGTRRAEVTSLAFGSNRLIALASRKETIHLFNLVDGSHLTFDTRDKNSIKILTFSISGDVLYVVTSEKVFRALVVKDSSIVEIDRRNF
ncbi:hypothetical protein RCL1_003167 [Eukaryota sp. TZLM3-RCL]